MRRGSARYHDNFAPATAIIANFCIQNEIEVVDQSRISEHYRRLLPEIDLTLKKELELTKDLLNYMVKSFSNSDSDFKRLNVDHVTKFMGEELVLHWSQVYGLPGVSLRLFNVYGTRSRTTGTYGAVFGVFLAQKLNQRPLTIVGDGTQTRDFTYVTDVAQAFYAAAQSGLSGQAMNVGSGNHYSINRLVELIGGKVEYIPKRPSEPDCTFAKITKITNLLDWRPQVSLEDGVAKMLANLESWRDAPVWDRGSIQKATQSWFKYLDK
jgi:dTDP-D-glucose 4,6-dehydratase